MAYLVYNIDDSAKRVHIGAAPITVGRQVGNLITLKGDDLISRFHAQFERRGEDIWVKDMGSRNGTRVNGKVVVEWKLKPGDVITIGKTAFTLTGEQQTIPANTPAAREPERFEVASEAAGVAPARALAHLAASLPNKPFEQSDIVLMDAKGRVSHDVWRQGDEVPAEAVTLLRLILLVSFRTRASDIHIEPRNDGASVRIRVDGGMVEVCKLKKETFTRLISLVKVLCEIDLSPRNQVQEGSFNARVPDRRVDYRVSFSPSLHGQKLVMRVLDAANAPRYLWDLNLPDPMFRELERSMRRDSGMILVCGPTGSGKTSTLYSVLRTIDATERNVVTIEDPIEIQIENVTQMPVDEDHGNSFPNLLRSVLRQDPDVILVGEIRDQETAKVAMQAAMTGHLVFSTVHSKDTVGSVFRLLDLGLEPFLVASGLQNLLAQRLVRTLCPFCKSPSSPSEDQLREMGSEHASLQTIYVPNGCARCLGTGFAGRRGVFELLSVTDELREAVQRQNQTDIMAAARKAVYKTLKQSGYTLVAQGLTTFDEVDRVVGG
ncbi:MAG TPA: GspE/PulE family protein [Tepidisphaeraceae bacterium]|nr:GspE/PulE family protein [Tepidisphaeraceae bacterium]